MIVGNERGRLHRCFDDTPLSFATRSYATKLVFDFADDGDAAAPFKQKVRDLTALKRTFQEQRTEAMARQIHWQALLDKWESLVWAFCADPQGQEEAFRERLSYAEKRHWLSALGVQATVYSRDHDPRYWAPDDETLRLESLPDEVLVPATLGAIHATTQ